MPEPASIKAIELARRVFEHVHGNIGLLKFNVEELTPTNGTDTEDSKKWDIVCSFYETLGSIAPSRYKVSVDLTTNSVKFKKISGPSEGTVKEAGSYKVVESKKSEA
ncbi:MAG: hypothetical protein HY426_01375 [Candidatus Levybacteria bacterium]|nr:hypothetical protein [Candidatus Levybacteria bacterium]